MLDTYFGHKNKGQKMIRFQLRRLVSTLLFTLLFASAATAQPSMSLWKGESNANDSIGDNDGVWTEIN